MAMYYGDKSGRAVKFVPGAKLSAQELLDKLKTVDGEGSGLDADTLDGRQADDFALKTDAPDLSGYMKESEFVGTGATKSVYNADRLANKYSSDYMLKSDYASTTSQIVKAAEQLKNAARTVGVGTVVESVTSGRALKLSVVTSLPSSPDVTTIYFVKE